MTLSADFTIDQQMWLVEIKDQSLGFPKLGSAMTAQGVRDNVTKFFKLIYLIK